MINDNKSKVLAMGALSEIITESLSREGKVKLTVTGNSMYPILRHRMDQVLIAKLDCIRKYDIVLYQRDNGAYILHRVVKKSGDTLYIAGDNEITVEYPVYTHQVIGGVQGFYRNNRYTSCNHPLYKLYSILWVMILPYRYKVLAMLKKIQFYIKSVRRKK